MISLPGFRTFVISAALVAAPAVSFAQFGIFITSNYAPPELPVYQQPLCPDEGYLWTPGFWAYGPEGYYWVPGTWVQPPTIGYLWTPGYWGYDEGAYRFNQGYWGPHIGFYGGVNYGFGYGGRGYEGGYWEGNRFNYNRTVNNVNITNIQNTYVKNVTVVNNNYSRVSYNGGKGGVPEHARPQELQAQRENHVQATAVQQHHVEVAAGNPQQRFSSNQGHPAVVAAPTPQIFQQQVQRGGLVTANPVDVRRGNQQQRIDRSNGGDGSVHSGQGLSGGARTVENRDTGINNRVRVDRPANGGMLTPEPQAPRQQDRPRPLAQPQPLAQPPIQQRPKPQPQQPQIQQRSQQPQPQFQQRPQPQQPQLQQPQPQQPQVQQRSQQPQPQFQQRPQPPQQQRPQAPPQMQQQQSRPENHAGPPGREEHPRR